MHAGALDYAMHNYAQLCTIMQNYARLCGLHCNEDTQGLQTRGNLGLRSPTNRQRSEICSSHSCLFWSENQLALPHFQTVEEFHRPAKYLQQWKHVHVYNKLHWTRVEQTIMHNYAQLCTIMQFGPIVNYAKLCTIMHVHNFPPPCKRAI